MNSSEIFNNFKWKEFIVNDVFNIYDGKGPKITEAKRGPIRFITASTNNNGVSNTILNNGNYNEFENSITICKNGKPGITFYQSDKFIISNDILVLKLKKYNTKLINLFMIASLEKLKDKYSYGKKLKKERLKKETIWLPIKDNESIDWDNMELYIKTLEEEIKPEINDIKESEELDLDSKTWEEFVVDDIFDLYNGKQLPTNFNKSGKYAIITSTTINNGIAKYLDKPDKFIIRNNMITIMGDGEVGSAFYHNYDFINTNVITALDLKNNMKLNKYLGIFLISVLEKLKIKYSYGKKLVPTRLKKETIWLPVNDEGQPDYQFMEDYIKSISFSEILDYPQRNMK